MVASLRSPGPRSRPELCSNRDGQARLMATRASGRSVCTWPWGKLGGGRLVPPEVFDMVTDHFSKKFALMYRAVTRQIEVTVEPNFLPERSSVEKSQYFWSYTIASTNPAPQTEAGSPRGRRRRGTAGARAGRTFRIHLRRAAADRIRLHDRPLPDGDRGRRALPNRRAELLARQPRQQE